MDDTIESNTVLMLLVLENGYINIYIHNPIISNIAIFFCCFIYFFPAYAFF